MTTAVQHRRGTTAEHATFTGLEGEVTIDTTKDTAVIHDGVLAGGVPLARENLVNVTPSGLATITGASTASDDKFFIYDQSATTLKSITRAELNNAMEIDALANVTITGGTINGTTIGNTTAAAGTFTNLTATGTVTIPDNAISGDKVEGGTINAITINTLTATNNPTLSAGTANGLTYLNGSKVLTTGSALTFDGTNLGVGTNSPLARLTVSDSSNPDSGTMTLGSNASFNGTLQYLIGPGELRISQVGSSSLGTTFYTNGSEAMRLTSTTLYTASGINVGIGLSSPSSKLDVSGVISLQGTTLPAAGTARLFSRSSDSGLYIQSATGGTTYLLDGSQNTMYAATSTSHQWSISNSIKLTLDSSGNLGLGVAPSAWGSQYKAVQNVQASLASASSYGWYGLLFNAYSDNTNFIYQAGNRAGEYRFDVINGTHAWYTAPSGSAGGTIPFNQAMTLDASGNVSLGFTGGAARFETRGPIYSPATNFKTLISANSTDALGVDVGAGISLGGIFQTTDVTAFGQIAGVKENATSGNYAGSLAFYTRPNGDTLREAGRFTSGGIFKFNSGYGSVADAYGCRVWANVYGGRDYSTGINASGNGSSFVRNSSGDYSFNFATAMVDINYSAVCAQESGSITLDCVLVPYNYLTTYLQVISSNSGSQSDFRLGSIAIFR